MKKKLLILFCTLLAAFGFMGLSACKDKAEPTYTVTFVADGTSVATPTYTAENKEITVPEVPAKTGYTGAWEAYTLTTGDITVNAVYTTDVEYTPDRFGTYYTVTAFMSSKSEIAILDTFEGKPVTSIGARAFAFCNKLTSITIPDSVTSFGDQAFYCCSGLTSITIPDSVTSIGGLAFHNCSSLTSVTIGSGVTSIGSSMFRACNSLTSITMPNSVISIGEYAFCQCDSLTSVTIGNGVTSIENWAFSYCRSLTSVTIPDSATSIGEGAFRGCSSLTNIIVSANNPNYKSIDGNLYNKDGSILIQYAIGKTDMTFSIPDSVTFIREWAFEDCGRLTSVTIGNGVTSIGEYAFVGCDRLASVIFSQPSGWKTGVISLIGLDNPATAALYLAETYCSSAWKRNP